MNVKSFVEFWSYQPGREPIKRTVPYIAGDFSRVKIPSDVYRYTTFDIFSEERTLPNGKTWLDGSVIYTKKTIVLSSGRENVSPFIYCGGKIYTALEIQTNFPEQNDLLCQLKKNGIKKAILCRTGNWEPFHEGDLRLDESRLNH